MGTYRLMVNGFEVQATFDEKTVSGILMPLLVKLTSMQRTVNRRLIVFLAAPPAVGKSTLAVFLEMLSLQHDCVEPIQALGIDGFHFHQDYILTHTVYRNGVEIPMKDVKGCPESFDVDKLYNAIQDLREKDILWPFYDRRLHDVVENVIEVNRKIVLIEGNWLLLNEGKWADLRGFCDCSIMIRAGENILKDRLIERKIRGGLSAQDAVQFYEFSERHNILRCLNNSNPADIMLQLDEEGRLAAR